MRALVVFRTPAGRYAVDVACTGGVVEVEQLQPLPDPLPGVDGLLHVGGDVLPLLSVLGGPGAHAVVVESGGRRFALLAEEVTGVVKIRDDGVAPPPAGQDSAIVTGVVTAAGDALLVDPAVLAERLGP